MPTIEELRKLFVSLKRYIDSDCCDEEGNCGIDVTIATDGSDWTYQTGDNSFMGGAYHYPHWAVVFLAPRSNSRELAIDAMDQLHELLAD